MSSSASRTSASPGAAEAGAVLALMLATFLVLMFRIGNPSYWIDEQVSLAFTQESTADLLGRLWGADTHRPWFYLLQKGWIAAFGTERWQVRGLNVVLAVATVPVIWAIGRQLGGVRVAAFSAAVLPLSPLFVEQAREVRMYPLLTLSLLLAVWALLAMLPGYRRAADAPPRRGLWAVVVLGATSGFYAQATGLLFWPLAGLALALGVAFGGLGAGVLRDFVLAGLAAAVLALPGLWPMAFHVRETLADFWIPEPSLSWVWSQFAGSYPYPLWAKPAVLVLLAGGVWALRRERAALLVVLAFVAGLPLVMWALSYWKPVLIVRAIAWPTVLASVLIGAALAALPLRAGIAAAAAVVALQALTVAPRYPAAVQLTEIDSFHDRFLAFDPARETLVLGLQGYEWNLRWNHPGLIDARTLAFSHGDRRLDFAALQRATHLPRAAAATAPIATPRFWVLSETDPIFPVAPEDDVAGALAALAARGRLVETVETGRVRLSIYETMGGAPAP